MSFPTKYWSTPISKFFCIAAVIVVFALSFVLLYKVGYLQTKQVNKHHDLKTVKPVGNIHNAKEDMALAARYAQGIGVPVDLEKAKYYVDQAVAASSDPVILTTAAKYYLGTPDVPHAIQLLEQAAQQQYAPALNLLTVLYANQEWGLTNYTKALYYAKASAQLQNAEGEYLLGELYIQNSHSAKNISYYIDYLTRAAKQGFVPAANELGFDYRDGIYVKKDVTTAMQWFAVSAKNNDPLAMSELALAYQTGNGVKKDEKKAIPLLQGSAQQGDLVGEYNLGLTYELGIGTKKDYPQAIIWLTKAAQQGDICSHNDLGMMYAAGHGVDADNNVAYAYFLQAGKAAYDSTSPSDGSTIYDDLRKRQQHNPTLQHSTLSVTQRAEIYAHYMLSVYGVNEVQTQKVDPRALAEAKGLKNFYEQKCWN